MTLRVFGVAVVAMATALSTSAPALTAGATKPVKLGFLGTVNVAKNTASGTFTGSVGSAKDSGTWTARQNSATLVDNWRIVGKRGTIIASDFGGRWTIKSGTKAYAGLQGHGGEISKDQPNGGIKTTWHGSASR